MTISFIAANNSGGQANGTTTGAGVVPITPTLPPGTASGDRVYVVQCASNLSATPPGNWNVLAQDVVIASSLGAVSAGGGRRYMSVYYRDYDGLWFMPSFGLVAAANNSHWIGAVALRRDVGNTWDTPTISSEADDTGTANTGHSATTSSNFVTTINGFLIIGTVNNDNVSIASGVLSQAGASFGAVTKRCDGGTSTGDDVSGKVHTCLVTGGANAPCTFVGTLSGASQGGNLFIQQTQSPPTGAIAATLRGALFPGSGGVAQVATVSASLALMACAAAGVLVQSGYAVAALRSASFAGVGVRPAAPSIARTTIVPAARRTTLVGRWRTVLTHI